MEDLVLSCLESRVEENRNLYARFLVGPFLKGDALTVATALRRVLLSSVESIGITALYIQGITHEFSTIVGVRESVLELSLNFQSIALCYDKMFFQKKSFFDDIQIGYLQVQGPKIVYANNLKLPLGVKLVDPTQYIATVSKEGSIVLKFVIGKKNNSFHPPESNLRNESIYFPILGELLKRNITRSKKGSSYKTGYAINQLHAKKSWLENFFAFKSSNISTNLFPIHFDRFCRKKDRKNKFLAKTCFFTPKKLSSNFSFKKLLFFRNKANLLINRKPNFFTVYFSKKNKEKSVFKTIKKPDNPPTWFFLFLKRQRAKEKAEKLFPKNKIDAFHLSQFYKQNESITFSKKVMHHSKTLIDHLKMMQSRPPFVVPFFGNKGHTKICKNRAFLKRKNLVLPFSLSTFGTTIDFSYGKLTSLGFADAKLNLTRALTCPYGAPQEGASFTSAKPLGVRVGVRIKNKNGHMQKFRSASFVTTLNKAEQDVCIPTINTSVTNHNLNHCFKSFKNSTFLSKNNHFRSDICLRNIIPLDLSLTPVLKVNFVVEIDDEVLYLRQKIRERIILEVWTNGSIHPRQAVHNAALSLTDMFASFRSIYQAKSSFLLFSQTNRFNKIFQTASRLQQNDNANYMAKRCRMPLNTITRFQKEKQVNALRQRDTPCIFGSYRAVLCPCFAPKAHAPTYKALLCTQVKARARRGKKWQERTRAGKKGQEKVPQKKTQQQKIRNESLFRNAKIFTYGTTKKNIVKKVKRNSNFFYKTKFEKNSLFFSDLGEFTLPISIHFFLKKKGIENISILKSFSSFDLLLFLDGNTEIFYFIRRFLLKNNFSISS